MLKKLANFLMKNYKLILEDMTIIIHDLFKDKDYKIEAKSKKEAYIKYINNFSDEEFNEFISSVDDIVMENLDDYIEIC